MTLKTSTSLRELVAQPHPAWLKQLGNAAIDLLFPPRCVACHRLGVWFCAVCIDEIQVIRPPFCHLCGLPLDNQASSPLAQPQNPRPSCAHCQLAPPQLDGLVSFAFHEGPLRKAITQLKYKDLRALAIPLGSLMANSWAQLFPAGNDFDVIVPVPLHTARLRERGYNQATILANELGFHLQKPVVIDALERIKATKPQVGLNAQSRRENVQDAFRYLNTKLAGKRVLLVDDVCTTGSTLEAACSALRNGGVSSVWAYTLARARVEENPVSNNSEKESGKWN